MPGRLVVAGLNGRQMPRSCLTGVWRLGCVVRCHPACAMIRCRLTAPRVRGHRPASGQRHTVVLRWRRAALLRRRGASDAASGRAARWLRGARDAANPRLVSAGRPHAPGRTRLSADAGRKHAAQSRRCVRMTLAAGADPRLRSGPCAVYCARAASHAAQLSRDPAKALMSTSPSIPGISPVEVYCQKAQCWPG